MNDYELGREIPRIQRTGDEAEVISCSINKMIHKIDQQAASLIAQERKNAITEYMIWQAQLDPHFVSNAMNIVNALSRQGAVKYVVCMTTALMRMLRAQLNTSQSIFNTVEKEVEILKEYVLIMRYRWRNLIHVNYEISDRVMDHPILRNVLQLLVENSLVHGFLENQSTEKRVEGNIDIVVYVSGGRFIIEVSDDGNGIEPDILKQLRENKFELKKDRDRKHVGLRNIYERLSFLWPEQFEMEIQSMQGNGTTVMISVPSEIEKEWPVLEKAIENGEKEWKEITKEVYYD